MRRITLLLSTLFLLHVNLVAQEYKIEFESEPGFSINSPAILPDFANIDRSPGMDFEGDGILEIVFSDDDSMWVYDGANHNLKWSFYLRIFLYYNFMGFYDVDADDNREAIFTDLIGSDVHFVDTQTNQIEYSLANVQLKAILDYDNDGYPEILVVTTSDGTIQLWGGGSAAGIGSDPDPGTVPRSYGLSQNYPNPFNPETTISYSVKEAGKVKIKIYNMHGQRVRTLVNGERPIGEYTITWDGKNERGDRVASGTYLYQLEIGDFHSTRKMVILK